MEDNSSQDNLSLDPLQAAQLQKLSLEIQELKRKSGWGSRLTTYFPLISVLLGVGGFLFGIYQFQKQQGLFQEERLHVQLKEQAARDAEQANKIQDQIRSNVEQIFQFTKDNNQSVSKAAFLLRDLRYLLEARQKYGGDNLIQEREISRRLVETVLYDCDFTKARDILYIVAIESIWIDYAAYLQENEGNQLDAVLEKNINAFKTFFDTVPNRVVTDRNIGSDVITKTQAEQAVMDDLLSLMTVFKFHLDLLGNDTEKKKLYLQTLQEKTCLPNITQYVSDISIPNTRCRR